MSSTNVANNIARTIATRNTAPPPPPPKPAPYWDVAIEHHRQQQELQAQLQAEQEAQEKAAEPELDIVDVIRSALAGTGAPVTESVPVSNAGTPAALNDVASLIRGALGGATVNGEPR